MASTTVPPPPPPGPNLNSNFCGPCPVDIGCRRRPGHAFQGSSADYVEGGEVCTDFPCPYCFEIYPISSLCPHIEDEHFFESKVAACPVCGERVHREMAAHITLRHAYLFKIQRRRKMPRASMTSNATNINGSIDSNLQAIIGEIVSSSSRMPLSGSSIDPIVSSLMFCQNEMVNRECPNPKEGSPTRTIRSLDGSLSSEERKQRLNEAAMRAKFVQELVISTLYDP